MSFGSSIVMLVLCLIVSHGIVSIFTIDEESDKAMKRGFTIFSIVLCVAINYGAYEPYDKTKEPVLYKVAKISEINEAIRERVHTRHINNRREKYIVKTNVYRYYEITKMGTIQREIDTGNVYIIEEENCIPRIETYVYQSKDSDYAKNRYKEDKKIAYYKIYIK